MEDFDYATELERRLVVFEDPENPEGVLSPLPLRDFVLALLLVLVASALMLWWGYF